MVDRYLSGFGHSFEQSGVGGGVGVWGGVVSCKTIPNIMKRRIVLPVKIQVLHPCSTAKVISRQVNSIATCGNRTPTEITYL